MMETTEVSETSVNKNLTPGKYPKESTLQLTVYLTTPTAPSNGVSKQDHLHIYIATV
jgi:hypothetical protein